MKAGNSFYKTDEKNVPVRSVKKWCFTISPELRQIFYLTIMVENSKFNEITFFNQGRKCFNFTYGKD